MGNGNDYPYFSYELVDSLPQRLVLARTCDDVEGRNVRLIDPTRNSEVTERCRELPGEGRDLSVYLALPVLSRIIILLWRTLYFNTSVLPRVDGRFISRTALTTKKSGLAGRCCNP